MVSQSLGRIVRPVVLWISSRCKGCQCVEPWSKSDIVPIVFDMTWYLSRGDLDSWSFSSAARRLVAPRTPASAGILMLKDLKSVDPRRSQRLRGSTHPSSLSLRKPQPSSPSPPTMPWPPRSSPLLITHHHLRLLGTCRSSPVARTRSSIPLRTYRTGRGTTSLSRHRMPQ